MQNRRRIKPLIQLLEYSTTTPGALCQYQEFQRRACASVCARRRRTIPNPNPGPRHRRFNRGVVFRRQAGQRQADALPRKAEAGYRPFHRDRV